MNPSNYSSISFPFLGLEMNPPRTFSLGPLTIHLYGIAIGLGLILAVIYACRRSKEFGLKLLAVASDARRNIFGRVVMRRARRRRDFRLHVAGLMDDERLHFRRNDLHLDMLAAAEDAVTL